MRPAADLREGWSGGCLLRRVPEVELGLALKVHDGATRAAEPALLGVLRALALLTDAELRNLASWAVPVVTNTRGEQVVRCAARWSWRARAFRQRRHGNGADRADKMFVDYAAIFVAAGTGGSGAEAFRREMGVAFGGPSGGDGGRGGDVVLRADVQLFTLLDYRYQQHYRAERGQHGQGRTAGRAGEGLVLPGSGGTV